MPKIVIALIASGLMLCAHPLFAAAQVVITRFAPFAEDVEDSAVDISVNGAVVLAGVRYTDFTEYPGFENLGCNDATATVTLDGLEPVMYTASQLTRPFPCTDEM